MPHYFCANHQVVEEKQNVFKTSIGNLPPGKEVIVVITYVTELHFDQDKQVPMALWKYRWADCCLYLYVYVVKSGYSYKYKSLS